MSDDGIKKAIHAQAQGEIGAFKLWCERRGIDFQDPKAVGQFWDDHYERQEARRKADRERERKG